MRITPFAVSLAVAASLAVPCFADPVTAHLEWRREPGAESCIDSEGLIRAVNRRWQRNVFIDETNADILVGGAMTRTAQGSWIATIELRREDGTSIGSRELVTTAPECSSLDDSIALAMGLMLDVSSRQIVAERSLPNGRTSEISDSVTGPSLAIPKETLAPRAPWKAEPSLGAEGIVGLMPEFTVAARVGVAVDAPRFFRVEVAGELWAPREDRNATGRGAHWSSWTAELAICPIEWREERLRIFGCVAQRFGQIRAAALGFTENTTATEALWTLGPRGVATFRIAPPLALGVGFGAEVPLVRYRFVYSDLSGEPRTVYKMAALSGSARVGLVVTF
jgi:hypothetical protein